MRQEDDIEGLVSREWGLIIRHLGTKKEEHKTYEFSSYNQEILFTQERDATKKTSQRRETRAKERLRAWSKKIARKQEHRAPTPEEYDSRYRKQEYFGRPVSKKEIDERRERITGFDFTQ